MPLVNVSNKNKVKIMPSLGEVFFCNLLWYIYIYS